jgi:hypothetical protein
LRIRTPLSSSCGVGHACYTSATSVTFPSLSTIFSSTISISLLCPLPSPRVRSAGIAS